ncbi:hypothetical protein [Clostridium thermarum]|uniref:hypothetical protein n=1 Tax=Clostridium thermarum TaxID=1716543 RepID=UPI0013D00291|nr:hypothetical protein [Clostridium thermarum]
MDNINFRFLSGIYLKIKNIKLKSLENQIDKLKAVIDEESAKLLEEKAQLQKLQEENSIIIDKYLKMEDLFKNQKKILTIKNYGYRLERWENVYIIKQSSGYFIQSKRQENIYQFEDNMRTFLDYLLTLEYSIIVLSVDKNIINLQLSLK